MDDFSTELKTARDDSRKCLALAILGEIGLRMGSGCSLTPDIFIPHFSSEADQVRLAAATALGNAAAGSVKAYLPIILNGLEKSNPQSYLLLHSVRELLQHPEVVRPDLAPSAHKLWHSLLIVSEEEDNRAVGAECVGRLALLDPVAYIPHFQVSKTSFKMTFPANDCFRNTSPIPTRPSVVWWSRHSATRLLIQAMLTMTFFGH
jgi:cullin-associated NEDD8-dissociated protein 1